MEEYLNAAIKAAKNAGKIALENLDSKLSIKTKGIADFVTNADIEAEKAIISMLAEEFPELGFLTEEQGTLKKDSELSWVIDPIDGTNNYIAGLPLFCTSIALVKKAAPLLGVIYDPNRKELFSAVRGKGAFLNNKKIEVSKRAKLKEAFFVPSSLSVRHIKHITSLDEKRIFSIYKSTRATRKLGAVALELAYLAAGRVDAVVHLNIKPWDGAAGSIIVKEAAGRVTNQFGEEWQIHDRILLATNGLLHSELMHALNL